jgi:hypothetical protein
MAALYRNPGEEKSRVRKKKTQGCKASRMDANDITAA